MERLLDEQVDIEIAANPELAAAWRNLQLYWLHTVPGYRETIKQRVSEAAIKADRMSVKIEKYHNDVDYLGQDIDGCG